MSTTQKRDTKAHVSPKMLARVFNMFISSANAKSFQFTSRSCFWVSWTRIHAGSNRPERAGAQCDGESPAWRVRAVSEQKPDIWPQFALAPAPSLDLEGGADVSILWGKDLSALFSCVSVADNTCIHSSYTLSPLHVHRRWSNRKVLAKQPPLEVPGAALRLDTSLPGFSSSSLAMAPWRLAAVDGETASHGMFWKLVKIMIIWWS